MTDEPFTLQNDPPSPLTVEFGNITDRQRVLFCGLDCLPGQLGLFDTDAATDPEETTE